MSDAKKGCFLVQFNRRIKLEFHGAKFTSDAGLLLYRELDEVLGLTAIGSENVVENRTGKNIQHGIAALLRQSVFSRLAGYKYTNDAERLRFDPGAIRGAARGAPSPGETDTVRQWLLRYGPTPRLIELLWEPLAAFR